MLVLILQLIVTTTMAITAQIRVTITILVAIMSITIIMSITVIVTTMLSQWIPTNRPANCYTTPKCLANWPNEYTRNETSDGNKERNKEPKEQNK
jgi:hypothetical protein